MKTNLIVLLTVLVSFGSVSFAQSKDSAGLVKSSASYAFKVSRAHHGKALFRYPDTKGIYVVTYTEPELLQMKAQSMARSLSSSGNVNSSLDGFIQ